MSRDQSLNSDLNMSEEVGAAAAQAARFSSVCKVYAPKYRQMTIGAVVAYSAGQDISKAAVQAYGDVLAAWRNFLATRNKNRPFVLIGHSQGTVHLIPLIATQIETNPAVHKRMKLAILAGFNVLVPQGKLVGGKLPEDPALLEARRNRLRHRLDQLSRAERPAARRDLRCRRQAGHDRRLRQSITAGIAQLGKARFLLVRELDAARCPAGRSHGRARARRRRHGCAPKGLASGRCVNDGARGYLSIRTNADPKDKRTDRIGGEVGIAGMFIPGWGMHMADMSLVQGDLIRLVGEIGAARR